MEEVLNQQQSEYVTATLLAVSFEMLFDLAVCQIDCWFAVYQI